jgi:hypothetical protein
MYLLKIKKNNIIFTIIKIIKNNLVIVHLSFRIENKNKNKNYYYKIHDIYM